MMHHYLAFGIPVISEIELPALLPLTAHTHIENPICVKLGTVPTDLSSPGARPDYFTYCNAQEMIYTLPEKIKFYIAHGKDIIIEPMHPDYTKYLLYFYSNCLAAILYQRNLIPFHVSGVFTSSGKVVLFAAPSGTGKSTLAIKLQELGFAPFTDDTAVLFVENDKCYAQASYPMMRLWENTLEKQTLLNANDKQIIYDDEKNKYGFSFHHHFAFAPAEVDRIIFLQAEGTEMQIKLIRNIDAFKLLSDNVYRCYWIPALQRNKEQFVLISKILQIVPYQLISRPLHISTFDQFPSYIKNILQ